MTSQGGKSGVNLISDLPLAGPDVREVWGKSLVSSSSSSVSLYSFLFLALLDSIEGVAVLELIVTNSTGLVSGLISGEESLPHSSRRIWSISLRFLPLNCDWGGLTPGL